MPKLTVEILADYGTIPQKIGKFLKKRNGSPINDIIFHTSLNRSQVVHGLSLLIQRRFVKYFQYERQTHYSLDEDMLYRRMFYSIYVKLVDDELGTDAAETFMKILMDGFVKIGHSDSVDRLTELSDTGVILFLTSRVAINATTTSKEGIESKIGAKICMDDMGSERKSRRISSEGGFYTVNFDTLDSILMNNRVLGIVRRRYSAEAERIYGTILKCNLITPKIILKNLEPSAVVDGENLFCPKATEEIMSYLKYLNNIGLIKKSLDGSEAYFKDDDEMKRILKIDTLNRFLGESGEESKRLFNMILECKTLEDKDIALKSLLPSYIVKKALFALHSNGFISLKYSSANDSKPVLQWQVKLDHTSRFVASEVKRSLADIWMASNRRWSQLRWSDEEVGEEEAREIIELVGLASDLFILGC